MKIRKILLAFLILLLVPGLSMAQDKATKSLTLLVNSGVVSITTASLPGGMVNLAYTAPIAAIGGLAPYSFSLSSGSIPAGLTLAPTTGIISGSPTLAGSSTFSIQVADSETPAVTTTQSFTVLIVPTLAITTSSLPAANIGVTYSSSIVATGGVSPYSFAVTTGSLPAGLTLSSTGTLSGTPTAAGTFTFTITVTDSATNIVRLEIKTKIEVASVFVKGNRS